jgi:hypothetical protein
MTHLGHPKMVKYSIQAPDDVIVNTISAAGQVQAGRELATLSSPRLDSLRASLTTLRQHIGIIERPYHDGRVDEEIQSINDKVKLLSQTINYYTGDIEQQLKDNIKVGEKNQVDWDEHMIKVYEVQSAMIDAQLSASQATRKKDDLLDKINSAKGRLSKEEVFLDGVTKALTITSPETGVFSPATAVGLFLKKGTSIGDLEI